VTPDIKENLGDVPAYLAKTLEAFHALPEAEQEALRDRFEANNHSIVMSGWKKRRASKEQPENVKMFSGIFAAFLDAAQKPEAQSTGKHCLPAPETI
jgi:hypothetical protein